jgi:predicted MFS family arabinose efflux permease
MHVYYIQAWMGLGLALAVPPWYAIFTRHIDHNQENSEWSMESVAIGISGASAAALSGVIVASLGFTAAFIIGGILALIGAIVELRIFSDLRAYSLRGIVKPLPDRTG